MQFITFVFQEEGERTNYTAAGMVTTHSVCYKNETSLATKSLQ